VVLTVSLFSTAPGLEADLEEAPNPKPTAADKARFGKFASLYTAFSSDFAGYALDICLREGHFKIADPFSGMGTLGEAGRIRPVDMRLADISPFAALAGAFRSAPQEAIEESVSLLERLTNEIDAETDGEFFSGLFDILQSGTTDSIATILATPSAPEHRLAALGLFLAAVSRIRLYKSFAGSNPTWVRRPDQMADGPATREAMKATLKAVRGFTPQLPHLHPGNRTIANWSGIGAVSINDGSLDAVVTSPPYPNRTDYIRHYQPASELLIHAAGREERPIRIEQIGTPLIRSSEPVRTFPTSVRKVLQDIRTHQSYASEGYYYKGFLYYFDDMYDALARIYRWLRPGGLLLLVVQDTYYKDIRVPTARLLGDIAETIGFHLSATRDWRVRTSLSHLSPHSRRSLPTRVACESVLALNK
jgi:hypothetical protein